MKKYEINNINENQKHKLEIICLGFNLQFDLILSLSKEQYQKYNIDFDQINNIMDLKEKFNNNNLLSLIKITSDNFIFNIILFLNRAAKNKSHIKYIIPFKIYYQNDISFMENVINKILEIEGITIIPLNLTDNNPKINFVFNLIINNENIQTKTIKIITKNNYYEKIEYKDYEEIKMKSLINSINKCDFVLSSSNDINQYIKIFEKKNSFNKIINHFRLKKLCIIYDCPIINDYQEKIIAVTDIYFFEKTELNKYNNDKNNNDKNENEVLELISSNNFISKELRKNKKFKIEIIIDELNQITIIQYDVISGLIIFKIEEPIIIKEIYSLNNSININKDNSNNNFYKNDDINNYINHCQNILINKYDYLKSVYIGAFLSRLFYDKTFRVCLLASLNCLNKEFKLIKKQKNFCKNKKYYKISIKKNIRYSKSQENLKNYTLEYQFILDGNNKNIKNLKKDYNCLYDSNCLSFFDSINNRKFLYKQGFINKKGRILIDPEKKEKIFNKKNKYKINNFQKEIKNFENMKIENDISQKLFQKLSLIKGINFSKNIFSMNTYEKYKKHKYPKEYYLPSLKDQKKKLDYKKLYPYDENNEIIKNLNKRYFNGNNLKIKYKIKNTKNLYRCKSLTSLNKNKNKIWEK